MTKYLQKLISRFEELSNGMNLNPEKWSGMPDSPETINEHIKKVKEMDKIINEAKKKLRDKQRDARQLRDEKQKTIKTIEKRATGLHADEEIKLSDYKIKSKIQKNIKTKESSQITT